MSIRRLVTLYLFALLVTPFTPPGASAASFRIDGSSTVFPLTEALAEAFVRGRNGHPRFLLGISGSTGGLRLFCRGHIDVANASRPIDRAEMDACRAAGIRYLEVPVAFDGITVVINPRNTWARSMTVAELSRIWDDDYEGLLTHWSDVRPEWPNERINRFIPGGDSATTEYFLQVIAGKRRSSRRDVVASENDNILLQGVTRDPYALSFFGYPYYLNNAAKLTAVAIDCGCGEAVQPSRDTVLTGRYFPLSRPLFIYVRESALEHPAMRAFLEFYLRNAEVSARDMGYFPLPAKIYRQSLERLQQPRFGTAFGGRTWTGINIEEALSHALTE